MRAPGDGNDPRAERMADPASSVADANDPVVGRQGTGASPFVIVGVFAVLAVALFLLLNARRTEMAASLVTPVSGQPMAAQPPAPPLEIASAPQPAPPPPPMAVAPPAPVAELPPPPPDLSPNLKAPAVVVDLQTSNGPAPAAASAQPATPAAPAPAQIPDAAAQASGAAAALIAASSPAGSFNANQQFAAQASDSLPEAAVATQLRHLSATITQGATIPGVLETAVNSDLPGYTRAVVSRDVRSFDGKAVLIPRGSRLIGQYRNALSLGQSRVFVIWTRVIRPDGVSVQIGSPGDDALGRGGLSGEVNSHFFTRFGGAILLSVLNTGIAAVSRTPSTQITIGSPAAAIGAAASATIPATSDVLPTIRVDQGAAITIFVARDLDFSAVKPVP